LAAIAAGNLDDLASDLLVVKARRHRAARPARLANDRDTHRPDLTPQNRPVCISGVVVELPASCLGFFYREDARTGGSARFLVVRVIRVSFGDRAAWCRAARFRSPKFSPSRNLPSSRPPCDRSFARLCRGTLR